VAVTVWVAIDVWTVVWMSVSVLVTVLGSTVTVPGAPVSAGAGAAPPPPPESCFSWWPLPELAAELVVVVVVVVVVLVVGAVVPFEPHATVSIPAAIAATPIVNGARRQKRAEVNTNGISLPHKVTTGQRDSYLHAGDSHQNRRWVFP
jgi:hypothetical protein